MKKLSLCFMLLAGCAGSWPTRELAHQDIAVQEPTTSKAVLIDRNHLQLLNKIPYTVVATIGRGSKLGVAVNAARLGGTHYTKTDWYNSYKLDYSYYGNYITIKVDEKDWKLLPASFRPRVLHKLPSNCTCYDDRVAGFVVACQGSDDREPTNDELQMYCRP